MDSKGQSSVEFTVVIGLALVLASPFLLASQSSIIQLQQASGYMDLDNSMDKVEEAAISLNQKSYPARRVVGFSTPDSVEKVYNPQFGNRSALVFETGSGGTKTNRSTLFDFKVIVSDRANLSEEGLHRISLKKHSNGVNISVIS